MKLKSLNKGIRKNLEKRKNVLKNNKWYFKYSI